MDPATIDAIGGTWQHPVDILEPEEEGARHKDRVRFLYALSHGLQWIIDAKRAEVGAWQVIYAFGLNQATVPMAQKAAELGVERATLSQGAVSLCKALDMPPSPAMRSVKARKSYSDRRKSQLHDDNERNHRNQPASR
jgi:hypothetical protein